MTEKTNGDDKPKRNLSEKKKIDMILESNGLCSYCKKKFSATELDLHHIKEKSKGGSDKESNLIVLCPNDHRKAHRGLISSDELKAIKNGDKKTKDIKSTGTKKKTKSEKVDAFGFPIIKIPEIKMPKIKLY